MQFTKLVKVLKVLKAQQLKRLKKYINSPYFGVNSAPIALFNFLEPLHPQFEPTKITAKKLAAYSAKLHTIKQQETAGVRLLRAIENFMAVEHWQQSKSEVTRHTLAAFKQAELPDEFDKGFKKQMRQLDQCPEQNFDTFFERHALTELSLNGFNAKLNRTMQNDIMPVIKTLDEGYALKKLRYLCEAINRKQFFGTGTQQQEQQISALLKTLEPYTNPKYPYIYLFVNVYRLLASDTYEDVKLYYALIKKLVNQNQGAPSQTMREAIGYAVNNLLNWYNKGYEEAGDEYLWWIEWRMKYDFLLDKGKLEPITFRNFISIATLNNKSPRWIEQAIKKYAPHLPALQHDSFFSFAQGLYYYVVKDYKKATRHLLQAQAKDEVIFNCIIRRWQWMCLYEDNSSDTGTLLHQLESFEKFIDRNSENLQHLSGVFTSFIDYAFKLVKSIDSKILSRHFYALQGLDYFAGKQWLLQSFEQKSKTRTQRVRV